MRQSVKSFLFFLNKNNPQSLSQPQNALGRRWVTGRSKTEVAGLTIALLSLTLIGITLSPNTLWAATINAASCSQTDVATAVASASNGDTVAIPFGTCSWTTTLTVTKGITLSGAGQGATILQDNVSKGGSGCSGGGPMIAWSVNAPNSMRMTGFTLVGVQTDPGVCQKGHITVGGSTHSMHLDHFTIDPPKTAAIVVSGDVWGVIDHLTFNGGNNFNNAVRVEHTNWNGTSGDQWGDRSWAAAINYGSIEGIYIEDSTFSYNFGTSPTVGNSLDCFSGGRIIFRHNVTTQANITTHGADSDQRHRGCRWVEIYNNTFTFTNINQLAFFAWIRGGTGVFYNNTVTAAGYSNKAVQTVNCRDASAGCGGGPNYTPWGACDGSSSYDGNTGGTGYLCVDQPGSGTSRLLSGDPPSGGAVQNARDPIYVWNNTLNGSSYNVTTGSTNVQTNRDYSTGTARPGYTAFTYPHPLTTGTGGDVSPPGPPQNLHVQ